MKKTLLLLMFSLIATVTFAQEEKEAIRKAVNDYFEAVEKVDINKVLDGLYPRFFELIPREDLYKEFVKTFNDEEIELKISNNNITNVSDPITYEDKSYSLVSYSFDMTMKTYEEEEEYYEGVEEIDELEFMLSIFKEQYGEENVTLDKEKRTFLIHSEKEMYAILDPEFSKDWKFVGKEPGMEAILYQLIPEEVVTKLH